MKIGLLGSGTVGEALAKGFMLEGHEVWLATRDPRGEKGKKLQAEHHGVHISDFKVAAEECELAVLCVKWSGAEEIVKDIGPDRLGGKIVIDASNIITQVGDAMVYGGNGQSAGEQVQGWLPDSKVIKAFNTVGAGMMYKPNVSSTPTMFIAGNDNDAKRQLRDIIVAFGWEPLDTGGIIASRSLEPMAIVWINHAMATNPNHAFKML